jgi:Holliday junction resolvasome RuvABC ATP-dependent DNA helicase subunit
LDKVRFSDLNTTNIIKFLVRKTLKRNTVFLIDEAHECSLEVLEWLRTINDIVPNLLIVFAGLPAFEKKIETELPTLFMRVNTRVYLEFLNDVETESLIQRRIEKVGGDGIKPFTRDAITKIYEITGGFPREVVKICDELVRNAAKNNISTINASFIEKTFAGLKISEIEEIKISLTSKQNEILEILNKKPNLSPTEIVNLIDVEAYKSKSHAIRSINNILRRLMEEDLLNRKKVGSKYVYSLSGKSKTIFTEA